MKLNLDPMPNLRVRADMLATKYYGDRSSGQLFLHLAYTRKREVAKTILAGGEPSDAFKQEADLRGVSVKDLAEVVVSKPDISDDFEVARQNLKVKLAQAKTPTELQKVLDSEGIGGLFNG